MFHSYKKNPALFSIQPAILSSPAASSPAATAAAADLLLRPSADLLFSFPSPTRSLLNLQPPTPVPCFSALDRVGRIAPVADAKVAGSSSCSPRVRPRRRRPLILFPAAAAVGLRLHAPL